MTGKYTDTFIQLGELAGDPVTPPPTGYWFMYFKSAGLNIMDDAGVVTSLGSGGGTVLANAEGVMKNGKIVRTISSNNLVVSIKTLAGTDPSASDPVKVVLGGTEYSIEAALSVTVNAGTSIFNAGSAQHLGQTLYLPVHLILRAAGPTVNIGVSRVFGRTYADFSATTTNDHYLAYSGSAPASTDVVVNIGYVSASNSGTASFNWSIPSVDIAHSIPVFELPWMTWDPSLTGFSSAPTNTFARYTINRDNVRMLSPRSAGNGTSSATTFGFTLPLTAKTITDGFWSSVVGLLDNSVAQSYGGRIAISSGDTTALVQKDMGVFAFTASGGKRIGSSHVMDYEY